MRIFADLWPTSVNITENGPGRAQLKLQWAGPGLGREFLEWAGPGRTFSAHFEHCCPADFPTHPISRRLKKTNFDACFSETGAHRKLKFYARILFGIVPELVH